MKVYMAVICKIVWMVIFSVFLYFRLILVSAQEVERFEHLDSEDGLSQNSVLSIFCDHKGFMWFGTWNGLNRYDGNNFKIFKSQIGKTNVLTNNRISKIWEDKRNFLWVQTYDGYYHYLNPENELFTTFPFYYLSEEEKNSVITCFHQENNDEIYIGSSNSGIYFLKYNPLLNNYDVRHYLSKGGNSVTNNNISFIIHDRQNNKWIGTRQGLNMLDYENPDVEYPGFHHYYNDINFTVATAIENIIWFGTRNRGLIIYDVNSDKFLTLPVKLKPLKETEITILQLYNNNQLIIGTANNGLYIYNHFTGSLQHFIPSGNRIRSVYEDHYGMLWVNTQEYGVIRIDPMHGTTRCYVLTPKEIQPLVDEERQYFYEDSRKNLWIGLHGAGLAHYIREDDSFEFFRNNPDDPTTISSNFVHCITEDKSGLLWAGTGQFNGGINKIIPANPLFRQILPKKNITDMSDNVIRCIFEDTNGYIWMATKSGKIYIYNSDYILNTVLEDLPLKDRNMPGYNIYAITQDRYGYIWLGSKGGGIAVSSEPLKKINEHYELLNFRLYCHQPGFPKSLSSNYVYSITEDSYGRIWIGTYGGGLNLIVDRTADSIICRHFNRDNSNITSNEIRQVFEDSKKRLWIATVFGLNLLQDYNPETDKISFRSFNYYPHKDSTISYNDVIHIFEDSDNNIWFATFGGGINRLVSLTDKDARFENLNHTNGLFNDAVVGILQDQDDYLWLSTENGVSRLDIQNREFENYNKNNGLLSNNFSENTCLRTQNGELIFGSTNGALIIYPTRNLRNPYVPPIVLTNFQLFNKDVDFHDENAPFHKAIEYMDEIVLKYNQSSFSLEYAALSFFDPRKNKYAYILENFDNRWNEVGNLRRAAYTNLSPGKYVFKVIASNWDGTWNKEPHSLKITILPPWWKTKLAYLCYFIILIIIVEIIRRVLTKYNRMRNDLRVERRVNEIKLQFFTNVSHEIRTPLTLILGPLEDIISHSKLPDRLKRSIEIMDRNGKRMLRLVNQLLDFRKIQKNKMKLKITKIEVVEFIKEICENFDHIARQKNIRFYFNSNIEEQWVWVDQEKFDSVLFNILSNAFKFTKRNKEIFVNIVKDSEDHIKINFEDQGPGISKDKLPELFQRFTPLSGSDVNYSGTGIGLALAYEIIKLHKGEIKVKSELNKGSCFTIFLRLGNSHFSSEELVTEQDIPKTLTHQVMETENEELYNPDQAVANNQAKTQNTVLVVEDNDEITNYIQHILEDKYKVITASNGVEGINMVEKHHPDLVVVDIMMPEMDGIQMTKTIKDNIETSHIPVIMLTAKSNIEDQIQGIESGAEAYILKPFNANYLITVIYNLLKQREIVFKKYRDKQDIGLSTINITSKDEKFLKDIVKIIEEFYSDPEFNVEKLIEKSYVGRTVLYNKIKGLTGVSPVEFLRQMRLRIAANLLRTSGYNVSEVGYMIGFNDIKYFSRCFKSQFGKTPSEFKNMQN
jgi:signal transduction histidine kinase/ligand-binding sensor domain-containing protein/CheY-like chemotaxis protein/AraC-like DNA-binding protein